MIFFCCLPRTHLLHSTCLFCLFVIIVIVVVVAATDGAGAGCRGGRSRPRHHQPRSGHDLSEFTSACHDTRTPSKPPARQCGERTGKHAIQDQQQRPPATSNSTSIIRNSRCSKRWLATHPPLAGACQVPAQHDRCLILPPRIRLPNTRSTWLTPAPQPLAPPIPPLHPHPHLPCTTKVVGNGSQ